MERENENPYAARWRIKEAADNCTALGKWIVEYREWWKVYGPVYKAPPPPPYLDTLQGFGEWIDNYVQWLKTDPWGDRANPPPARELNY